MRRRTGILAFPAPQMAPREMASGWWGKEWIASLQAPSSSFGYGISAGHDSRLARARTYARKGAVGEITVRPGSVASRVKGSRRTRYRCEIYVPELSEAQWDKLFEEWTAAGRELLLEFAQGRLGVHAVHAAVRAETDLVPPSDAFVYHCSCPDWGDPCKHAAALSYAFARALDTRAEALLVLRGRDLVEAATEISVRHGEREQSAADEARKEAVRAARPTGVPAGVAFARARARAADGPAVLPVLPAPVPAPAPAPVVGQERAEAMTAVPLVGESVAPEALHLLAVDAARRAAAVYAWAVDRRDATSPEEAAGAAHAQAVGLLLLDGDPWHDTVRRAAAVDGDLLATSRLLNSSDRARAQLARARVAWRYGGPAALTALEGALVPPPESEAAARERLLQVRIPGRSGPPRPRRTRGRLQLVGEDVELRWGSDGRWYPYRKERGHWWAAGPPATDADEALGGALGAE
ncbi:SWIM zinc finger family protein [Streptomyces sp. A5-4]|uniref:SWIM zinc finger family protein n=1 Tax=Streptomyces sp. A5-4 TaxID=3384771 RepID=UPI003DAA1B5F